MFSNDMFFLLLYLIFATTFNESYKVVTKKMQNPATLTVVLQIIAGISSLLMLPFFKIPANVTQSIKTWLFVGLAIIFYTLQNRFATIARSGIEASTYGILKQLSNVLVMILAIIFLKEELTIKKLLGASLLIGSNILIFYQKGLELKNRYLILGIIANLCMGIALFFDINSSKSFSLPIYVAFTFMISTLLIATIEKISLEKVKIEWKIQSKKWVLLTAISWSLMLITKLRAYQLGEVSKIAPLSTLTVLLNIVISYFFLNEQKDLKKKLIAIILILIGVIFMNS